MTHSLLDLFEQYTESDNELLERIVARVLTILVTQDGNFNQLIEAMRKYPTAYALVIEKACERAGIPNELQALLRFYKSSRDRVLWRALYKLREGAVRKKPVGDENVLVVFANEGLTEDFALQAA